jgi:putative alpha-1,2-mannosidase
MAAGRSHRMQESPVDVVYPYIGTINPKTRGATPVIKAPGGSVGLFPSFTPEMQDMYLADKIYGFPLGVAQLMVTAGEVHTGARENASHFDHDLETATAYSYQALLEDSNINVEYTPTDNAVFFRFTLPEGQTSQVLLSMAGDAAVRIVNDRTIEGSSDGRRYFHAELSVPAAAFGTWRAGSLSAGSSSASGRDIGLYARFPSAPRQQVVEMKVGISSKSAEEARDFAAREIGARSFDQVKAETRERWNRELSLIEVEGGTDKQRALFYTTLHRTRSLRMGNVWDTYRSAYPLQTLIHPEENLKTIRGWIQSYERDGWIPDSGAMIGHHSTAVIVDSYMRGLRDFDVEKAYEGMRKNHTQGTMIPWKDNGHITELEQTYFDKGFYPALPVDPEKIKAYEADNDNKYANMPYQIRWKPEVGVEEPVKEVDSWHRRQSVSVTLEHAYDDWCLAQMAKALGKEDDYRLFMARAHNYQNLYKPSLGLMAPKSADGQWIEPFDPRSSGGFAGEAYFAEGNAWIYTWHVQHDVQGLINLMGGRDKFTAKLDELFTTRLPMDKLAFLGQLPDMTGLMGMYVQGNEPSFHIPYLYNYAGQPWKTQRKVREIMDLWYDTTPGGLSGDEDGGAMSSWYVLSAMGLYPQCPGQPIWDIGSPLFEKTTIHVGDGKTFVIEARDVSARNKYIQSATLNGQPWNKPWIHHADVVRGGRLVFQMGPRPNKDWGSAPEAAAPSMSAPA